MISSEVQRTLVKSAPELWAEVSDPAALARHLGELGEIRITRIDPEQKVEWEACDSDTSGTVVIKPSGWGTKVKLTVTRVTAEIEAPIASEGDPKAEVSTSTGTMSETETKTESAAEATAESVVAAEPTAELEPTSDTDSHPDPDSDPDLDTDAATAAQQVVSTTASATEAESEPIDDTEVELEPTPALELVPQPEPRRGFFARLFGRFRAQDPVEQEPLEANGLEAEPLDVQAHEADALTPELPHHADSPQESASAEPAHDPLDAHAAWAAWAEPSEIVPSDASQPEPDLRPAAIEPPHAREPHESVEQAFAMECAPAGHAHDAEAIDAPVQTPAAEPHAHADQSDLPSPEPTDISAEIGEAEEVTAEEVTAVLTGVLDRLGAAHHRPFSRA